MFLSKDTEKSFDKIQYPFLIKALKKTRNKRNISQPNKAPYDRPIAYIIGNIKKFKIFSLKPVTRQGFFLFSGILEVLARAVR